MEKRSSAPPSKRRVFAAIVCVVVALDVITKLWAQTALLPQRIPREVLGDWVRLTLVYNPGAAFGLYLGSYSRVIFLVLTAVALVILGRLYATTRPGHVARIVAIGLVCGGAIGNLIDRVISPRGVVDFLDLGIRDMRWPTFNVADIAVTTGALLLAWVLWVEDARENAEAAAESAAPPGGAEPNEGT
ncbi:MAG TPA: signal peptidase II [Gemmatimonadaceae bacterium]|nr:signal peptidase II [Gemmatimonadaceae bacterium]